MSDFFDLAQHRLDRYRKKYAYRPGRAAAALAFFSLKYLLQRGTEHRVAEDSASSISEEPFRLGIAEGGGLGDALIQTLYIRAIRRLFRGPVIIHFYCRSFAAFRDFPFIDGCFPYQETQPADDYDVFLVSRRFYVVCRMDEEKTKAFSRTFWEFCTDCRRLTDDVLRGEYNDNLFTQYALIHGRNRLEQADCHGFLPVNRQTPFYMCWDESAFDVLARFDLEKRPYITLSRACDGKYGEGHPKLWPLEYYRELVRRLRERFPDFVLMQLGADRKFPSVEADLDLRGETSLEETKCLLKYARLHIDVEGGLVHLRHALQGRSLVLFGPTSPEVFGYGENVNLRSRGCPQPCEWVVPRWTDACLLGTHACMTELRPDEVFARAEDILKKAPRRSVTVMTINRLAEACTGGKAALMGGDTAVWPSDMDVTVYDDVRAGTSAPPDDSGVRMSFEYASPYNIPASDGAFEVVYFSRPQGKHPEYALEEAFRILGDGGRLVCPAELRPLLNAYVPENFIPSGRLICLTVHREA